MNIITQIFWQNKFWRKAAVDGVRKKWSAMTDNEKCLADEGLYETELQEKIDAEKTELPFGD